MTSLRLLALVPLLLAADWPEFLGPNRDGTTPETLSAISDKPEVLWRTPIGPAHSSPVVVGGRVYAFYQPPGEEADALAAFDAKTGKRIWETKYPRGPFTTPFGTGPRSTPTVSGDRIVTFGPTGVLSAFAADGKVQWQADTLKVYGAKNLLFGVSASPLVAGGKVVVPVGGQDAGLVAFDLSSGRELWRSSGDPASYASPIVTGDGADRAVVALTGSHLRAVKLADGKPLWEVPFKDDLNESSTTPVVTSDLVLVSSVTRGSAAFTPNGTAAPNRLWTAPKLTCYFSTPVVVGDDLYLVTGEATLFNASVTLRCVDAKTGRVRWNEPRVGKYHAAILKTANNRLLMLDDLGRLTHFAPNSEKFDRKQQVKVCGETWAHPALSGGVVYLRDNKELIAVKVEP